MFNGFIFIVFHYSTRVADGDPRDLQESSTLSWLSNRDYTDAKRTRQRSTVIFWLIILHLVIVIVLKFRGNLGVFSECEYFELEEGDSWRRNVLSCV